ncbi:MAG: galactose mutarotase [Roseibium sp.]|nr:galactose mutarotase [Roseibium sp.]
MPDGKEVGRIFLKGDGLTASFLTYGTVLQDLRLDGHAAPLVLGFESFAPYLTKSPYFGATAGRCANRIRDGHLQIDGKSFQLDRNFLNKHALHGGTVSMGKRCSEVRDRSENSAIFTITLKDGEMGYPGVLKAEARFALLPGGVLNIVYTATTDAPTVCNLAHHSYFNLDGGATILNHDLKVFADHYLPVDEELIPTGEIRPVAGTAFDFRQPAPVSRASATGIVDHNFCTAKERTELREVARLRSRASRVSLTCSSTEPGLQVYDGAKINIDHPGLAGLKMGAHAGLALEPQIWPDAVHHAGFPSPVLRPGETYRQHTQYTFELETS